MAHVYFIAMLVPPLGSRFAERLWVEKGVLTEKHLLRKDVEKYKRSASPDGGNRLWDVTVLAF